jgi:MoaA/NifB/PqqE/SkfB family radical SAM enzyme
MDEAPVEPQYCDIGPELLSIALLNPCDLKCPFCYAPKSNHRLGAEFVLDVCKQFSTLGTLEVAFGGGEPTLFSGLGELCRRIWTETDLGISLTTHGHHLTKTLVDELITHVSIIRVSIDAPEPIYSRIRGRSLEDLLPKLSHAAERLPLGINTVVNGATLPLLDDLARIVRQLGAVDWLLLPETKGGAFTNTETEWEALDRWISDHLETMTLRVSAEAVAFLTGPFPLAHEPDDYAHIRADRMLCRCSYAGGGILLTGQPIIDALRALGRLRPHEPIPCCGASVNREH